MKTVNRKKIEATQKAIYNIKVAFGRIVTASTSVTGIVTIILLISTRVAFEVAISKSRKKY